LSTNDLFFNQGATIFSTNHISIKSHVRGLIVFIDNKNACKKERKEERERGQEKEEGW
jgi:rRNA processing protein Gar1